jgi:pyruvate ferredoxin oxidoreductase beta subunit
VYSGIWPYTGKKGASLHGVFGGTGSEMLGGLAARKARLKHAHKINGEQGAAYRANLKRTLHLGWAGDGATFDIGFGNLSGLFSRLQKLAQDPLDRELGQRALYVCYDNEGYQNTGNQYSAAVSPGGNTTTNPSGEERPMGNELRKKHIVEIVAEHGASISARMNIHRQEHIIRVANRALEDGIDGAFLHFLQPCTTGWKFNADSLTYDLAYLSEEGGLFAPVTFEHGVPYLEMYPTPRNPGDSFLKLQARFRHLLGSSAAHKKDLQRIMEYYSQEWLRNLQLCGYEGEIPYADRLGYLEQEHRSPRVRN